MQPKYRKTSMVFRDKYGENYRLYLVNEVSACLFSLGGLSGGKPI